MKLTDIPIILLCLISSILKGQQIETNNDMYYNGDSYRICKIPVTNETVAKFQILENKTFLSHQAFLSSMVKDSFYLIINASVSDSFCNPIGYYAKNYQVVKPIDLGDGKGNFYLKPNGALLFTATDAIICESSKISNYQNVRLGVQSGPLLIANGVINKQFNASSQNKNIRCGVGIFTNQKNEKFLVFCVSNNPVTFYNFAQFFHAKLKCNNALCLESGNCVIGLPYLPYTGEYNSNGICNYLYFPTKR